MKEMPAAFPPFLRKPRNVFRPLEIDSGNWN
jgi:hypothetical protein